MNTQIKDVITQYHVTIIAKIPVEKYILTDGLVYTNETMCLSSIWWQVILNYRC